MYSASCNMHDIWSTMYNKWWMLKSSLPKNVVFSAHVHMHNAAYISSITWNSISGLDSWLDFLVRVSCDVAVKLVSCKYFFQVIYCNDIEGRLPSKVVFHQRSSYSELPLSCPRAVPKLPPKWIKQYELGRLDKKNWIRNERMKEQAGAELCQAHLNLGFSYV